MSIANYVVLKQHFDKLIIGGHPVSTGLEPIRDTYEASFCKKIHLYDVFKTRLNVSTNPIGSIVSLVGGAEDSELESGIMISNNEIVCVNVLPGNILRGLDESDGWYVDFVYNAMKNVVKMDRFYMSDRDARDNPLITITKALPLYFTFYHIKECAPRLMGVAEVKLKDIMEKYIVDGDDINTLYESLNTHKYTKDFEAIYPIITANNSIALFR